MVLPDGTSSIQTLRRGESGGSLVEFAISATLLLTLILGVLDCSCALYADNFVANAASEATRYARLRGYTYYGTSCATTSTTSCMATSANVTSFVQSLAPAGIASSSTYLTATTTWPGTTPAGNTCNTIVAVNAPGCLVTVKVTYNLSFMLPFAASSMLALTSTSSAAISQ